ncbi:LptM family lipoprotein (plasmid) [Niallia taxi]|uniref:LptM family lipoprotein n=1 Tax=Niallia taxi TaxID=2499688 RepID=UPI003F5E5565
MKKKLVTSLALATCLFLAACGNDAEISSAEVEKKADEQNMTTTEAARSELSKAGQKAETKDGMLELLKMKAINKTIDVSPLAVTIKDMRLFKMTNVTQEHIDILKIASQAANDIKDEYVYVQIRYEVENKEDKNIVWEGLKHVVTDKGQQVDRLGNDIIYTEADSLAPFAGKVTKEFDDGFIFKLEEAEDISKIKFVFAPSMDGETYEDITPIQEVEYSFE